MAQPSLGACREEAACLGVGTRRSGGRRAQGARTISPGRKQNVLTSFLPPARRATLWERGHLSGPPCSPLRRVDSSIRLTSFPSGAPR